MWTAQASTKLNDPTLPTILEDFLTHTKSTHSTDMNLTKLQEMDQFVADLAESGVPMAAIIKRMLSAAALDHHVYLKKQVEQWWDECCEHRS